MSERLDTQDDSFPALCQEPNCPGGRAECHTFATYREICSNGCGEGAGHAGECDTVPTYHGEPAPELTKAIWAEAERRYPNDQTWQSCFNDGCHWLIQRVKRAQAELKRLDELDKRMQPWTDREAFLEFNRKCTVAYGRATNAIAELLGTCFTSREPSMTLALVVLVVGSAAFILGAMAAARPVASKQSVPSAVIVVAHVSAARLHQLPREVRR